MTAPLQRSAQQLHGLTLSLLALQLALAAAQGPGQPLLVGGGVLLVAWAGLRLRSGSDARQHRPVVLAELLTLGLLALQPPALSSQLLQGLSAVLLLAALVRQEAGGTATLLQVLRRSVQLALAALPLLALLVVLPRWGPLNLGLGLALGPRTTGRMGLNAVLDPGSLSALQRSTAPALRIRWRRGSPPPPALRYWRVLVLDHFDGRRWSSSPRPPPPARKPAANLEAPPDQLWLAEPMPATALPWPGSGRPSPASLWVNGQGMLLAPTADQQPRRYGITQERHSAAWVGEPPPPEAVLFPPGRNPQLEQLGASWRRQPATARIQAAEQLFRRQGLRYTATPAPLPPAAPLDALLFGSREGFCEHLASAFTALMRAAGLPARVVVGYQGGHWVAATPWGPGYLDVRQSEAHAWSEVWLDGRGWQRIDPTAWLAPQRLTNPPGWSALPWQPLEQAWQQLLLNDTLNPGLPLLGATLALAASSWALRRPARQGDRLRRRLERSLAPLQRWALQPHPGETLPHFCERAAQTLPELRQPLLAIANSYDQLRFNGAANPAAAQRSWRSAEQTLARSLQRLLRRHRPGALQRVHPSSSAPVP